MQARDRIGDRYELTYPIGRGGMGEVWAGYDERLDRPVAIKFLRQMDVPEEDRATAVERFKREARATARLDHPGVPTVHDLGVHGDDRYIVMQLVPGMVLADLVAEEGQLSIPSATSIAAQICSVLTAAHTASLVHRDLKPQNVIITPNGIVKVLDFGVAALLGPADASRLTTTGRTVGTPAYIAPEQALNAPVGPGADLYALGCVLFELLTGDPPYQAETALDMLHRHMRDPVPLVTDHRAEVPADLTHLVFCLLAKDPQERPASAADVYHMLVPFLDLDHLPIHLPAPSSATAGRIPFRTHAPSVVRRPGGLSSDELTEAHARARELAEGERFVQAAEVLEAALSVAGDAPSPLGPQVLALRLDLANLYVLAGAYREALPQFSILARDLAQPKGDRELTRHCRQQVATCQAELGQITDALTTLRALLADEQQVLPPDDPEVLDLHGQIGRLRRSW